MPVGGRRVFACTHMHMLGQWWTYLWFRVWTPLSPTPGWRWWNINTYKQRLLTLSAECISMSHKAGSKKKHCPLVASFHAVTSVCILMVYLIHDNVRSPKTLPAIHGRWSVGPVASSVGRVFVPDTWRRGPSSEGVVDCEVAPDARDAGYTNHKKLTTRITAARWRHQDGVVNKRLQWKRVV